MPSARPRTSPSQQAQPLATSQNVIADPGFESGTLSINEANPIGHWGAVAGSGGTISITSEDKHSGTNSLKVVSGVPGDVSAFGYAYQFFTLGTTTFTFSFWYKGLGGNMEGLAQTGWTLGCGCGTSLGVSPGYSATPHSLFPVDSKWHQATVVRTPSLASYYLDGSLVACEPRDSSEAAPASSLFGDGSTFGESGTFYFDDASLEPGNLLPSTCVPSPSNCAPAPGGLVSWWPLDGNANDIHDNNPGTVVGTGGQFVAGVVGSGFQSGGLGSLVQVPDNPNLSPAQFTIDAWVKVNTLTVSDPPIVWKGNSLGQDTSTSYGLSIFGNPGSFSFPPGTTITGTPAVGKAFFLVDNGVTDQVVVSSVPITIGSFVHLAGTSDGSKIRLYVNGSFDVEANQAITPQTTTFPFQIGSITAITLPGAYFDGVIDEVQFYNSALTATDVLSIYNAGTAGNCKPSCVQAPSGLVGWWPGDGNGNDLIAGNNAVLSGGASFTSAKVGQGFNFSSDTDAVTIANKANLNVTGSGFGADFWMKGVKNQPQPQFLVVDKSHGWIDSTGWLFQGDSATGKIAFGIGTGGAGIGNFPLIYSNVDVLDGSFHHVAGVWDGNTILLYVDGVVQGNIPLPTPANNNRDVHIGFSWGGGTPNRFFRGVVDELEIFSRAPTGTEIQTIFNAGSAGNCKPCVTLAPGIISWWPGDGNTNDIIGNRNGILANGAGFVPGIVGQAFNFNGVDQYVNVTNDPAWNLGINPFTIDLWVKFNQPPGHAGFIGQDEKPGNFNKWFFGLNPNPTDTGKLSFAINGPSLGPITLVTAPSTPNSGQWYHVAVTRGSDTYVLYINGVSVASATNTTPIPNVAANLIIGSASWPTNGQIDEVQIFNRALSSSEIGAIFNAGSAGCCKTHPVLHITTTSVDCVPSTVVVNQVSACTVTVTDTSGASVTTPAGSVTFTPSATCTLAGTGTSATCSVSITPTVAGALSVSGSYPGDTTHAVSSGSTTVTVNPRTTTTTVACAPSTVFIGQATPCAATVTDTAAGTANTPTGSVTFTLGGACTLAGTGASASCSVNVTPTAPAGSLTVSASYPGDTTHAASSGSSTVTVTLRTTTTTVACTPTPVFVNQATSCTAAVADTAAGTAGTPTGTVTLTPSGTCTLAGTGTTATCSVSITPTATGTLAVAASYLGGTNHAASSGSVIVTVNPRTTTTTVACTPSTVVIGQATNCTATVTDIAAGTMTIPTGTVTFTPGGTCTLAGTGASATCSVSTAPTASGTLTVSANYSGDTTHATSSGPSSITVNKRATTTTLSCPASGSVGVPVTCSATVADGLPGTASTPAGTVSFTSGTGTFTGSPCTLTSGTCTFTYTPNSGSGTGVHILQASYSGDSTHLASSGTTSINSSEAQVKCGGDDTCTVQSNSTITKADADKNRIKLTATGAKGTIGWANVTVPKTAVPNINRLRVTIDGMRLARSSITITMNATDYFVYFTFTFHSPVDINLEYNPTPDTLLGLDPTIFYESIAGIGVAVIAAGLYTVRKRKAKSVAP